MHLLENSLLKIMAQLKRGKSCFTYTRYIHIDLTENKILYSASLPQDRLWQTGLSPAPTFLEGWTHLWACFPSAEWDWRRSAPSSFLRSSLENHILVSENTSTDTFNKMFPICRSVKLCKKKDKHDLEGL